MEVYQTQKMQWTSKLKTSHTWGKYHLEGPLKCIESLLDFLIFMANNHANHINL